VTAATQPVPTATTEGAPFTVALRPGVPFPEWAAITSPNAGTALTAILSAFDLVHRWGAYDEEEDRVRRTVIEGLAELDHAPDAAWIAARTGLEGGRVAALLDRLVSRDLVVRASDGDSILGAYPLTTRSTEHRVRLGGRVVQAMCAVDALGAGAMFGSDVAIESRCRACGVPIRIVTRKLGTALDRVEPPATIVWSGVRYEGACAATSLCTVIAFFCSESHLEAWRQENHAEAKGYRLALDEAMQVGRALFAPVLRPAAGDDARTE
jgi:mercuric reductase